MDSQIAEGGCFCGAVRYRAGGGASGAAYCHCRTCRKTSGAPVTAWAVFPCSQFSFTRGDPLELRSSEHVTRTFCGKCGTPLTCRHDGAAEIDITCSSLDQPEGFRPTLHLWTSHALPWVQFGDRLRRVEGGTSSVSKPNE